MQHHIFYGSYVVGCLISNILWIATRERCLTLAHARLTLNRGLHGLRDNWASDIPSAKKEHHCYSLWKTAKISGLRKNKMLTKLWQAEDHFKLMERCRCSFCFSEDLNELNELWQVTATVVLSCHMNKLMVSYCASCDLTEFRRCKCMRNVYFTPPPSNTLK